MEFDYKKELLPGLPIPEEGTVSDTVYYTGGTLSDVRQIINPDYFPLFENGLELSEEEFLALSTKLDRSNINFTYRYRKGGHLGYRLKYNRRIIEVSYIDGKIHSYFADEYRPEIRPEAPLRAVVDISREGVEKYIGSLVESGYVKLFENTLENNLYVELTADGGKTLLRCNYFGNTRIAYFILNEYSTPVSEFGYSVDQQQVKPMLVQYALYQSRRADGFKMDCGMCYLLRLCDNSLFMIDGGMLEQATDAAAKGLIDLMHRLTNTQSGEKMRLAGWFCTHAHEDHVDMFTKLLRLYHDEIDLERVMFNFQSENIFQHHPEIYMMINRVRKYYPNAKFRKLHAGDEFTLADTVFTVLQTHEDSIGAGGNELIGSFNDMSTVLSVVFDGKKSLVLGDIDGSAENLILSHYSEKTLKADIVQVAHHLFNYLDRLYDVIDADYAMVPQRSETKVNHDNQKYKVVARTVKDTNFRFANDGTDGFEVDTNKNEIVWTLHQEPIGGVYDGSEL